MASRWDFCSPPGRSCSICSPPSIPARSFIFNSEPALIVASDKRDARPKDPPVHTCVQLAVSLHIRTVVFCEVGALLFEPSTLDARSLAWENNVFCERCGLNFLPKQSFCTRCKVSATRHWFQLMSLVTLTVAVACNALVSTLLLPRLAAAAHGSGVFRAWLWFDYQAALYGWVPIAVGLLAWDFLVWKEARPKVKGWFTRKLLTFSLAAGVAPMLPWWVPAGQPPGQFLAMIGKYPGLP